MSLKANAPAGKLMLNICVCRWYDIPMAKRQAAEEWAMPLMKDLSHGIGRFGYELCIF